jgi:hypothetical protein
MYSLNAWLFYWYKYSLQYTRYQFIAIPELCANLVVIL